MDVSFLCRLCGFALTILVTFATDQVKLSHRKLTTQTYGNDLAYVKAEGKDDTLHYLFSGYKELSILSFKSSPDGIIQINTTYSPPQVELKPAKSFLYAFGIVFDKLAEYDDTKDSARITDYNHTTWYNHSTSMEIVSAKNNMVVFRSNITIKNITGKVTVSFQNFVDDDRQDILPHLKVTSNSSLIDFTINRVEPSFNKSRFALVTSFISQSKSTFSIKSEKSLDDEYTPGTFQVSNWVSAVNNHQSFLQWKPVCYFDTARSTMTSTYVKNYKMTIDTDDLPSNSSLAYNYFATTKDYKIASNIISFGLTEDKFYVRNDYTAWSATIGYGVPPSETVSTIAIVIISVGLGIPVLLFVAGGIYLCVKRRRSDYQQVFGTISS